MKLLTLNIEHGRDLPALFGLLTREQPAIACLQEVFAVDVEQILHATGYQGFFAPVVNFQQTLGYPVDARGEWGELLLYHPELIELAGGTANAYAEHYYVGARQPIPYWTGPEAHSRVVQVLKVSHQSNPYVVGNTHFTWSANAASTPLQEANFQSLARFLDKYPDLILCGDFNAPRGGKTFELFTQRFTDNIPAEVSSTIDSARHYSGKSLELVVDNIFTPRHVVLKKVRVLCGVSDHCAVVGEVETNLAEPE